MKDKELRQKVDIQFVSLNERIADLQVTRNSLAEFCREFTIGKTSERLLTIERKLGPELSNHDVIRTINESIYRLIRVTQELGYYISSINDKLETYINQSKGGTRDVS
jgi:hypothetical protein